MRSHMPPRLEAPRRPLQPPRRLPPPAPRPPPSPPTRPSCHSTSRPRDMTRTRELSAMPSSTGIRRMRLHPLSQCTSTHEVLHTTTHCQWTVTESGYHSQRLLEETTNHTQMVHATKDSRRRPGTTHTQHLEEISHSRMGKSDAQLFLRAQVLRTMPMACVAATLLSQFQARLIHLLAQYLVSIKFHNS